MEITHKYFAEYIEEIQGYAKGVEIDFKDSWVLIIEAELNNITEKRCTSIFTNEGNLGGATKDCFAEVKDRNMF